MAGKGISEGSGVFVEVDRGERWVDRGGEAIVENEGGSVQLARPPDWVVLSREFEDGGESSEEVGVYNLNTRGMRAAREGWRPGLMGGK